MRSNLLLLVLATLILQSAYGRDAQRTNRKRYQLYSDVAKADLDVQRINRNEHHVSKEAANSDRDAQKINRNRYEKPTSDDDEDDSRFAHLWMLKGKWTTTTASPVASSPSIQPPSPPSPQPPSPPPSPQPPSPSPPPPSPPVSSQPTSTPPPPPPPPPAPPAARAHSSSRAQSNNFYSEDAEDDSDDGYQMEGNDLINPYDVDKNTESGLGHVGCQGFAQGQNVSPRSQSNSKHRRSVRRRRAQNRRRRNEKMCRCQRLRKLRRRKSRRGGRRNGKKGRTSKRPQPGFEHKRDFGRAFAFNQHFSVGRPQGRNSPRRLKRVLA